MRDALTHIVRGPSHHLGQVERFPEAARQGIRVTIEKYERLNVGFRQVNRCLDALVRYSMNRRKIGTHQGNGSRTRWVRTQKRGERILRTLSGNALLRTYLFYRRLLARVTGRTSLSAMLSVIGEHPSRLMSYAAHPIPQLPDLRGYWSSAKQKSAVGYMVGMDLVPTEAGCWFLENNISATLRYDRSALYERDPLVTNLITAAKKMDYKNLVVLAASGREGMNPLMYKHFDISSREMGLPVTVVENPYYMRDDRSRSRGIPDPDRTNTFTARFTGLNATVDWLLGNKDLGNRALHSYLNRTKDPHLMLPDASLTLDSEPLSMDHPFPNFVFKIPSVDQGAGIVFIKTATLQEAEHLIASANRDDFPEAFTDESYRLLRQGGLLAERYVRSQLIDDCFMYKIRAHALLCPGGPHFLSAHRVTSTLPIPAGVEEGIVLDDEFYNINIYKSAKYQQVPDDEIPSVARATLAVARGLSETIESYIDVGPSA